MVLGYFGDLGSIMVILVIYWVFFLSKKIYFTFKNYHNFKKPINIPEPLK